MAEHVKIGSTVPRIQYTADGGQAQFSYPFAVFSNDDLCVFLDDTETTTGFVIDGAGNTGGGGVTFSSPPAAGTRVTLMRRIEIERRSDFTEGGTFRASVINDELDCLTASVQQVAEEVSRAPKLSALSSAAPDLALPEPEAGKTFGWNETGDGLVNDPASLADALDAVTEAEGFAGAAAASAGEAESYVSLIEGALLDYGSVTETTNLENDYGGLS